MIPKEGKDPLHCQNYRPIPLLNVDLKIFTKTLSIRLMETIPQLIHSDQVVFVPTREAWDNTTKAINLIHAARTQKILVLLLSADAENAFHRANWPFLLETLRCVGLGQWMMNWVQAIYSCPSAQVKVNGHLSSSFAIANEMRQGCPPVPLDIYLDPLTLSSLS